MASRACPGGREPARLGIGRVNPHTGKPCTVYHHPWGDTYVGGDWSARLKRPDDKGRLAGPCRFVAVQKTVVC
jgi:hypothetical protein